MRKFLVLAVLLVTASCAGKSRDNVQASSGEDLNISLVSSAEDFGLQLDGGDEVLMTKSATDATFTATFENVSAGEHALECINEDENRQVQCPTVYINGHAKCAYSADKLQLKFSSPVTAPDEGCREEVDYINFVDAHRSMLFEQLNPVLTQQMVDVVTTSAMQTVSAELECLGDENCSPFWGQLVDFGIAVRPYVNGNECPVEDWVYSSRPYFKQWCAKVSTDYPACYLQAKDGGGVITWEDPVWHFHSKGINLTTTSPRYEGKTCGQLFVDHLASVIALHPFKVLGIEFDRLDAYCSWFPGIYLKDPVDGHELNYWETDVSCREGHRDMLKYARQIFGDDFIISVRSKSYYYSDLVDGVTFESPFIDDIGGVGALHPFAVMDKYLRMSQKTRFVTFAHCDESQCRNNAQVTYSASNRQETGYAAALLAYNGLYAFDKSGQNGHGSFVAEGDSVYTRTGEAVGDVKYPYLTVYNHPEEKELKGGKSFSIPVEAGQIIRFAYAVDGMYGQSSLSFPNSGSVPARWVDGTIYQVVQASGKYTFSFAGPGKAVISEIRVFDPAQTATDFMYCRDYKQVKACYNPSTTMPRTIPGTAIVVPPTEGRVVAK